MVGDPIKNPNPDDESDDDFDLGLDIDDQANEDEAETPANLKDTIELEGGLSQTHPMPTKPPESASQTGSIPDVPGYEILSEIGQGAAGVVYLARQINLNRTVALKMMVTGGHIATLVRAQTEAESVAHLQHPNIIQIFEVQAHNNAAFFAFEYVDGGSLNPATIKTPREAAELVAVLARGVHYAHAVSYTHLTLPTICSV